VALAAVFSAGVAANNFFGAIALATFYPILVWSLWITRREKRIVVPAIAIPVLAYGLTAFWLVPSYFQVPQEKPEYVSEHGTLWLFWVAVVVAVAFVIVSDRFARARPERAWAVFIAGCVVFFSLKVFGGLYFNLRISGEPARLLPELDMSLHHGGCPHPAVALGPPRHRPPRRRPGCPVRGLLDHYRLYPPCLAHVSAFADYQNHVGVPRHRLALKNIARCGASSRPARCASWYDAWHDLPQLGGGSDQGLLNGEVGFRPVANPRGRQARTRHPLDAVHGRRRDLCIGPALPGDLQGFRVSAKVRRGGGGIGFFDHIGVRTDGTRRRHWREAASERSVSWPRRRALLRDSAGAPL